MSPEIEADLVASAQDEALSEEQNFVLRYALLPRKHTDQMIQQARSQ